MPRRGPSAELLDWQQRLARALDGVAQAPAAGGQGATAAETAHRYSERIRLQRYTPERGGGAPVLIVYSLVNRPFILDLTERRSLIRALLERGHPVYLLDWGYPQGADRFLSLDDYIGDFLASAAEDVAAAEGARPHLLGVCQGGVFALCLAALHPERVRRLVTLVTPVDCRTADDHLSRMAQHVDFDRAAETLGNVSAHWLNAVFVALKPYRLLSQRYVDLPELADQPEALDDFLRMERWMYDSPDQAAAAFAQFARELYQRNRLYHGTLALCGERVGLDRVRAPVLNVYAAQDHLVPPAAAQAMGPLLASREYEEIAFPGGHLGVFISRRAHRELIPRIAEWLGR
ncbi:alpha/beta fold hydrolase [Halorhodospira neutriphila]|uniref:Class III poly(R)-hydroxyalkanoic acid synthase subunit PhaC n=1 Tax=Halorhodospira neutriphila TaxID=168379 RepID=A0ABS1E8Z0_9GAMM|nr:alpha/beta fold hydrolase [Halorhodospira neutriphila]MBK1726684.1 class III poly(R)-hydroxyalkanoic acid synthase subunit PhaC [Halorhodospira neutriphila]